MFKIFFEKRAQKELNSASAKNQTVILNKVVSVLGNNPFPKGKNPKRMKGGKYYRLRSGNIRILYVVDGDMVKIFAIGLRKDVYRKI
jgi:mRNA-degrading endonuclease RelE of RelBE toxin-antitoxin system